MVKRSIRRSLVALALVVGCWLTVAADQQLTLPLQTDSVRFGVIGDNGTGRSLSTKARSNWLPITRSCLSRL
jgi:hypothetical protein